MAATEREKSAVFCSKPGTDAKQCDLRSALALQIRDNRRMNRASTVTSGKQTVRMTREALLQKAIEEPDLTWRVLITLNVFRLLVAATLLTLFFTGGDPRIFGDSYPIPFAATATAYLLFAIISATCSCSSISPWSSFSCIPAVASAADSAAC